MSQRIEKLREKVHPEVYPFCVEKARLATESWKETEGEPQVIRMAKAQARILDELTIFIEDDELIVGNAASKPMGVEVEFAWFGTWPKEELDGLAGEGFCLSESDIALLRSINEYWEKRNALYQEAQIYSDERLWPFKEAGVTLPPWKSREGGPGGGWAQSGLAFTSTAGGASMLDWRKVLNCGLNQIIEEAEEELKKIRYTSSEALNNVYFLRAVIIAHKAIIRFANRFAILAAEMASKEKDPVRKKELKRIASTCQWVPANPARNFYEAIQLFWFVYLVTGTGIVSPMGRFDQYMYPFYKNDIDEGKISDEEVLELLQCLRLKDMQINATGGKGHREKWSGLAKWHNMVIGGQTADGEDATNELSYLILEAVKRCPTPHHTITLRVHEGTPEDLMLKALEVVRTGIGIPAFIGDKSYIEYFISKDVPIRLARDYDIIGCLDANLRQAFVILFGMFITPLVFDYFLHNGVEPRTGKQIGPKTGDPESFETFDELMEAWKKQLAYFMKLDAEVYNIQNTLWMEMFPCALESAMTIDGIKEGKDVRYRKFPYKLGQSMNTVGLVNVADSLAAIKKLVFDEKKVTMKELKAALDANWQGNGYDELRKMCLAAPKYGNDDDYVDSIVKELYQFYANTANTLDAAIGEKFNPGAISISAQGPGGALTGATPDGRYSGETLADGSMSAMRGRDTHGPTALIKSASKIDQNAYQSTLLNMKLHPSALQSTEDMKKLSHLIKTYFSLGGKHIQFNIVSKDTLLDAQTHPENYHDLIVRVAGYSAYFTQLTKVIQDEVIERMEHQLA